ncbi:hypothetical protein HPB49_020016 [Dermacentor silvarum]|uniref:Uncharacterized protein n=1 Tax=Dermacentor silvarum TaxID=543639 RepID=A0ACB8E2R8_DERSI|nr:hypothetical protein HPB49_020016 [Dermacentor silvarum]
MVTTPKTLSDNAVHNKGKVMAPRTTTFRRNGRPRSEPAEAAMHGPPATGAVRQLTAQDRQCATAAGFPRRTKTAAHTTVHTPRVVTRFSRCTPRFFLSRPDTTTETGKVQKKFLEFFFRRLRHNDTGKYEAEFPFISPCGREMNFVHCDDVPFVFTHIVQLPEESKQPGSKGFLLHNHAGNLLKVEFTPQHLCMPAGTGRVYHPAPERAGGVGLVRSLLAIELSKHFTFADDSEKTPPTHFDWDGTRYELTNSLLPVINKVSSWNGTE